MIKVKADESVEYKTEELSRDVRIQAALINNLYQQWRGVLLGVLMTSTGVAFLFYNEIPNTTVLVWIGSVYLLLFVRHLSVQKFKAHTYKPTEVIRWGWVFAFYAFLSGVMWGAASLVFFTPDNLQLFNVLTLIIIAMSVGSLAALSSFPAAYYVFVLPEMLPIIWRYMNIDDQDYHIFGALMFVFLVALFSFSRVNYKTLRNRQIFLKQNFWLRPVMTCASHCMPLVCF